MSERFGATAIIGVGLLGASLGLALKARGLASEIRGAGRRKGSLDQALAMGAIDSAHLEACEACEGADLIVVCTPAALVPAKLDEILPVCGPDTVVTDVASTKSVIAAHAAHTWPRPLRFVGSHPMAGSEKFGPEHGHAGLYEDAWTIVCPREGDDEARLIVVDLWESVGSRVVEISPEVHDATVALTSHVPHVVSACLAELAGGAGDIEPFIGKGFRDATRIAGGRPEIWRDICLTNPDAIVRGLDTMADRITAVKNMVLEGDAEALHAFFSAAREARRRVVGE